MSKVGLLDLLGVATTGEAADLWPLDYLPLDPALVGQMIAELAGALSFDNVRPGASGDAVGLWADMTVGPLAPVQPIEFAALPKFGFLLQQTFGGPARVFVQQTGGGVELIIEALPIEVLFPDGLLLPFEPAAGDVTQGAFDPAQPDTYEIALRAAGPSSLKVFAKLRVSETFDFVLEFATPVSVGPCRFSGVACAALHDLSIVLTPNPTSMDARAQALEWLRHPLDFPHGAGGLAVRTVDLFSVGSRVATATAKANEARPAEEVVEPVLEDIVLIPTGPTSPFPLHFSAGVRRGLQVGEDPGGVYRLGDKPVVVALVEESAPGAEDGVYLIVRQVLLRSFANGTSLVDPQTAFLDVAISNDPAAQGWSGTVELSDAWTLSAGFHVEPPHELFSLFNVHVKGLGARLGVSFQRLFDPKPDAGVLDPYLALGDLVIVLGDEGESEPAAGAPVEVKSKSGKPTTIVANGVGWKFGEKALGNFWQADKIDLKAGGVMRLSIDEFGFVTEPDGGRYFSFSGSWPVVGTPSATPEAGKKSEGSFGIQFYRLRWRIHGDPDAPVFLIDGLGLFFQTGLLSIIGSGMLSDRREGHTRFAEAAFGVELSLGLGKDGKNGQFTIAGQVLHGTATTTDPAHPDAPPDKFTYLLSGVAVSPIPLPGGFSLVNLRGLFAWNMQPKLGPGDPSAAQPMRLFDWTKAHADATELPATRNIVGAGWEPRENAWAFAAGAGLKLGGGNALTIDAFFLYVSSPAARSFLAALKLFLGGKKPIAYGVVEVEGDHWSALVGLALGVQQATGKELPSFFDAAPSLTGTFYATNEPATFAIGRLNDTSSWLALRIGGDLWVFKLKLFIGVCLEIVDAPDGPRVLAFRAEFSGGTRKCAIGSIEFSLSMQLTVGVWRSESRVSGFIQTLEGNIRINVLYVFRFGASFKVNWAFLGPDPAYRQIGCEVRIHTPWWMPDKTFRWNRTLGEAHLERMTTVSPPLQSGAGHGVAAGDPTDLPVSALSDDPQAVLNIADLQALGAPALAGDAPLVPIDAVIALQFKPAVDDRLIWGQVTPPDASLQDSNDVSTRYELVELGIRRRPLSAGGSAPWTVLLDPALSRTDDIATLPPAVLAERKKSPLAMRWDADFQREQALDPRLLLLNSELPWRFMVANLIADENLIRTMPGWPCCPTFELGGEHVLDWEGQTIGARAPLTQLFRNSLSIWRWIITPPLVVAPAQPTGLSLVRLPVIGAPEGEIVRARFDTPAAEISFRLTWKAMHLPRGLVITAFRGLKPVAELVLPLSANSPARIEITDSAGIDHLSLRITGRPIPDTAGVTGVVELESVRYRSRREIRDGLLHDLKCGAFDPDTAGNGSRFAWLPNHEYEVQLKTRVQVGHASAGALEAEVPQILRFRTRGPLGLNATDRVGSEIEPYVDSSYPPPGTCLYRTEPALLAFDERFDILQRVDHPVLPSDPPERKQRVDWELCARLIAGDAEGVRLSATGADWIVAHRGTGSTVQPHPPIVRGTRGTVREALSIDPMRLRFEAAAANVAACGLPTAPTRKSRVLSHAPADPRAAPDAPPRWPARARVRMGLRIAGAPFVDRRTFEAADATAFTTAPAAWQVSDGALGPDVTNGVQIAQFGEPGWLHYEAQLRLRALGARAGLALAVSAIGSLAVWLDASTLRIVRRSGAQETELKSAPIVGAPALHLTVTAYDDEIVATAGSAELRIPRGNHREGRLALLAEGETLFESLRVDGLDGYRFEYDVSRFDDFAAHVGSFSSQVRRLPAIGARSTTIAELEARNAPFTGWVAELGIPLQTGIERLEIGLHASGLLVIESPEPFGGDLRLALRQGGQDLATTIVADERGAAFLLVPVSPLAGDLELEFGISLTRYRAASADDESRLVQSHMLAFTL